jgi:hypothetical protein
MSKTADAHIADETEHQNPNRRTAMMLAAGAAAVSIGAAIPAGASPPYRPSQAYLDCVAAREREMTTDLGDEEGDRHMRENGKVVDRFLAFDGPTTMERLGEIALIWRLNGWEDSDKGDQSEKLERALWQAIEELTGVKPQGGLNA